MARLIDVDALIKRLRHSPLFLGTNLQFKDGVIDLVERFPAVDAVVVVRCKECKHWHHDIGWCDKHSHFVDEKDGACHPWESLNWKMFDADDFCSYGERKVSE